jgi:hypothetical protein
MSAFFEMSSSKKITQGRASNMLAAMHGVDNAAMQ